MTYSELIKDLELLVRIMASGAAGIVIGHERKSRDKSAGMRTHAIVAMGAALMMVVSKYGFFDIAAYDASRVAAQIVSGVGFLGAGVIFVKNNSVSGLTTAAGIWTTAGIGMAMGAGMYAIGISATILIILTQFILHKINFLAAEPYRGYLKITTNDFDHVLTELQNQFRQENIRVMSTKVAKEKGTAKLEFDLLYPARYEKNLFIAEWSVDTRIVGIRG